MSRTKWIVVGVGVAIILAILFLTKRKAAAATPATRVPLRGAASTAGLGGAVAGTGKPAYGPASAAILTGRISGARDVYPVSDGNSTGGAGTNPARPPSTSSGGRVSGTGYNKELEDSAKVAAFQACVANGGDPTVCRLAAGLSVEGAEKLLGGLEDAADWTGSKVEDGLNWLGNLVGS